MINNTLIRMKWNLIFGGLLTIILMSVCYFAFALTSPDPLPCRFKVYLNKEGVVINYPSEGYTRKILPTVNLYLFNPGCYVMCYTNSQDRGIYSVAQDTYTIGQIRVKGEYSGRVCVPFEYNKPDLETSETFKDLCSKTFKCIGSSCWAGGDTGAWFGIP